MSISVKEANTIIEEKNKEYRDLAIRFRNVCNDLDKKDKEIERLNNINKDLLNRQNEALSYIGNHLSLDSRYKLGNGDNELKIVRNILNKHKENTNGKD